jgi:hypothetical protein
MMLFQIADLMIMIGHQAVGAGLDLPKVQGIVEEVHKIFIIFCFGKNLLTGTAPVPNMTPGARIFYS